MEDVKVVETQKLSARNKYCFGLGTIGRDMVYTMVSMFLVFYLSDIMGIGSAAIGAITVIFVLARVWDAVNDPVMGTIVDSTKSKWGKYKPWMLLGTLLSGALTILLFADFGLQGAGFVAMFAVIYLAWGMSFTANDISYWSLMPSLTHDQKERESIGSFARICANVGLFVVVAGITPITQTIGNLVGSMEAAYTIFAAIIVLIMWGGQAVTLFGVKEPRCNLNLSGEKTSIKGMLRAIFKNDQLLFTAISMALFMIGYMTTTSFGLYYFKYVYGNADMYSIFAVVLGVSQILALIVFPLFSKRFSRRQLFTAATILVVLGYVVFILVGWGLPQNMVFVGIAGVLIFVGQAFIQLLMLMFLADSIEYGEWKLKKRNESITFSLQPFVNKAGGAIGSGILGLTLIISGISDIAAQLKLEGKENIIDATSYMSASGVVALKIAMMVIPLLLIVGSYFIYFFKYKIDAKMYANIVKDLKERGSEALGDVAVVAADAPQDIVKSGETPQDGATEDSAKSDGIPVDKVTDGDPSRHADSNTDGDPSPDADKPDAAPKKTHAAPPSKK